MRQYYLQVLGLPADSNEEAIRKAYRKLAKQYHPDVSTHPDAQKKFVAITEAYDYLISGKTTNYRYTQKQSYSQPQQQKKQPQQQQWQWQTKKKQEQKFSTKAYSKMTREEYIQTEYYKNTKRQLIHGVLSVQGITVVIIWGFLLKLFFTIGAFVVGSLLFLAPFAFVIWALYSRPK